RLALDVVVNDLGRMLALREREGTEIEEFDPGKPDRIARIKRIIRLRNRNRRDSPAGLMRLPHVTAQSGERQLMLRFSIRRILYCALRRDAAAIARIGFPDTAEIPLRRRRGRSRDRAIGRFPVPTVAVHADAGFPFAFLSLLRALS